MTNSRVALVTGAARGIGRDIAVALGQQGYIVGLNDLAPAQDTQRLLEESGGAGFTLPGDISDEAAVVALVRRVLAELGRIDVLVNNAGISFQRRAEEITLDEWQRVLAVNLTGPFLLCREVGQVMLARTHKGSRWVASRPRTTLPRPLPFSPIPDRADLSTGRRLSSTAGGRPMQGGRA